MVMASVSFCAWSGSALAATSSSFGVSSRLSVCSNRLRLRCAVHWQTRRGIGAIWQRYGEESLELNALQRLALDELLADINQTLLVRGQHTLSGGKSLLHNGAYLLVNLTCRLLTIVAF